MNEGRTHNCSLNGHQDIKAIGVESSIECDISDSLMIAWGASPQYEIYRAVT